MALKQPMQTGTRENRADGSDLSNHRHGLSGRFERAIRAIGGGVDYVLKVIMSVIDTYQRFVDYLLDREIAIDRYFTYIVTRRSKRKCRDRIHALHRRKTSICLRIRRFGLQRRTRLHRAR